MEQFLLRARNMDTEEEKPLRLLLGRSRCSLTSESIEIERDDRDRGVYISMAFRKPGLPSNPDHVLGVRYVAFLDWVVESHWISNRVALFKDYNEKTYRYLSKLISQRRWGDISSMIYAFVINIAEMIRHPELDLIESYIDEIADIKTGIYDRYSYEEYGRYDRHIYKSNVDFDCNILYDRSGDTLVIGAMFRAGIDALGVDKDRARLYISVVRELNTMDIKVLEVTAILRNIPTSNSIASYMYPNELDRADRLARIHDHLVRIDLSRHTEYRYMVEKTLLAKNLLEIRETAEEPKRFRKEMKRLISIAKIVLRDADERIANMAIK